MILCDNISEETCIFLSLICSWFVLVHFGILFAARLQSYYECALFPNVLFQVYKTKQNISGLHPLHSLTRHYQVPSILLAICILSNMFLVLSLTWICEFLSTILGGATVDLLVHLAFDLSLKALRHSFAITKECQRKASLSLGGWDYASSWGPCGGAWSSLHIEILELTSFYKTQPN